MMMMMIYLTYMMYLSNNLLVDCDKVTPQYCHLQRDRNPSSTVQKIQSICITIDSDTQRRRWERVSQFQPLELASPLSDHSLIKDICKKIQYYRKLLYFLTV